jgi:putative transposase
VARRKFSEEKILQILKEAESHSVAAVCRNHKITGVTFYRWRTKYEGLRLNEAKKMKDLEDENRKLKRIVADMSLDIHGLKEVIRKKL